jgi:hypothetical protein
MTSLTALTHAAAPAAPAFNGLFYATAATIIPVLFLAIAVQGRGYENLMKAACLGGSEPVAAALAAADAGLGSGHGHFMRQRGASCDGAGPRGTEPP